MTTSDWERVPAHGGEVLGTGGQKGGGSEIWGDRNKSRRRKAVFLMYLNAELAQVVLGISAFQHCIWS